jgi:lantibiotic modifying enzyme
MKRSARVSDPVDRMLAGIESCETTAAQKGPLEQLCHLGVTYGWHELERGIASKVLARSSAKAHGSLRQYLDRTLQWITRPCFELEWTSYIIAVEALGLNSTDKQQTKERFLGVGPYERLISCFKRFPALAELWSVAIDQWRDQSAELLARATADKRAIGRAFFDRASAGRITNVRLGLSDRHLGGRTVAFVEFEQGRVAYKPRSGASEAAWASLLHSLNLEGFEPRLRQTRILRRKKYHWMEWIEPAKCHETAAVRRFYIRLGGLIAGAHLLSAVDCHRENLIAAGEHPVLVDIDALWHVSSLTQTKNAVELLYRTGFFPNQDPASLQSRSSILGKARSGTHLPRIGAHCESAADYIEEIVAGFDKAWRCLVGTERRRANFRQRHRRIRSRPRRWIYRATESYAAIIRASLQPAALISSPARDALIRRLASAHSAATAITHSEIEAMARLDIPYFIRRTSKRMKSIPASPPSELRDAIRRALATKTSAPRAD